MKTVEGFSKNALRILKARYFMTDNDGNMADKTPSDLFSRVADHIASAEQTEKEKSIWKKRFFEVMRYEYYMITRYL